MRRRYPAPNVPYVEAKAKGGKQRPSLIVISSSWTTSDAGAALGIARTMHKSSESSTHYVLDEDSIFQCVWDQFVAAHCGYDTGSIGIKMCDDPSLLLQRWNDKSHQRILHRSAELTAQLCLAYSIPARFLTNEQLEKWAKHKWRSRGGIVTAGQIANVFDTQSTSDPLTWPRYEFLSIVHNSIEQRKQSTKTTTKR